MRKFNSDDIAASTLPELFDLSGHVALVTGASRGIGLASAALLAEAGARVVLVARDEGRLALAAEKLTAIAGADRVHKYSCNAGSADQVDDTIGRVMADLGRIDILVNNAATNPYYGPMSGLDMPRAEKTAQVNMLGPILWIQQAWSAWMREHGGVVINVASIGPFIVEQGAGMYAATKAALIHLTRQFAAELGPGVRVNAVAPGLVKTELSRTLWEDREDSIASALPLGRLGAARDIAASVLFLSSAASAWMTGHTMVIDGGALATPPIGVIGPGGAAVSRAPGGVRQWTR
ncbi:NAD(P)-dependent dehydrogenase, short-chain alcohol dehydrogenase family [Amycolatopsis marina]|uniref:NAD(P)-dependent dehydrogenase, short-chain alcohol dehydrogenase family n=1 Tax=Amycolatopsis marina TaxID=490629 RepID=A0A1I1AS52_9PSEU|nr:SDR family oxidoreductase [Amycolatopsis marina]SFB40727.1 NAD(P)-dependent dehydrogenase, short-chain alcohol dehydrogenase family [Amycolatopsis marina]